MKTVEIISGKFTDNGNFSGYDAAGQRIHVPGRAMEAAGMKKGDDIKFPLFALVVEREFNVLDENGNAKEGETFKREQAGSIFTKEEAMITALNSSKRLAIKAAEDLKSIATAAGLSETAIDALLAVA